MCVCVWWEGGGEGEGEGGSTTGVIDLVSPSADDSELQNIEWRLVIIDEAHRLKNRNCKLLEGFKTLDMVSREREMHFDWPL